MTWKRGAARAISEVCAIGGNVLGWRRGFRVLLFHAVGSRLEHDSYGISISPALFEDHMAVLASSDGFSVVGFQEASAGQSNLQIAVTFDDGYKDNLYVAAPILLKYRIPFTVFVTSAFLDKLGSPYLAAAELRQLADLPGVSIGSHGASHVSLTTCDDATLWQELNGSRCSLEDVIGRPVTAIAYPHGSVNERVLAAAGRAGYSAGACSRSGINGPAQNPLLLCRTELVAADSARIFLQKLSGAWDWRGLFVEADLPTGDKNLGAGLTGSFLP